jgi:putative transposase
MDSQGGGVVLHCPLERGNPSDNAQAKSFFKTLKWEEVNLTQYRNLEKAAGSVGAFIEQIYNRERLHSALGYLPAAEFEQTLNPPVASEQSAHQRVLISTP